MLTFIVTRRIDQCSPNTNVSTFDVITPDGDRYEWALNNRHPAEVAQATIEALSTGAPGWAVGPCHGSRLAYQSPGDSLIVWELDFDSVSDQLATSDWTI